MKRTSIVLMIGLFAVGCGETKKPDAPSGAPANSAAHMSPPSGAHGGGDKKDADKKDEDKKEAEGEKAAEGDKKPE
jgi:hypothetical protein